MPAGPPLVVVVRNDEEAHRLADDLSAWQAGGHVAVLPERAALPLERALPEHEESAERLEVLAWLGGRAHGTWCWSRRCSRWCSEPSPRSSSGDGRQDALAVGERIGPARPPHRLVAGGYEPAVEVSGVGEFANRGGIMDVWPPGAAEPLRVELFGDEIESLRAFDPMSQGSRRRVDHVTLLPASEFLPPGGLAPPARSACHRGGELRRARRRSRTARAGRPG